ncbi:MAG TPA: S-adenosylmethionine:tRNA ribosyltransferase-isomerase [Acidimicrobiales bacterium]|nr:S-adenosylmethionine:tRNA ribosyltransferase-isomerase [Acidimicrobiales bacterium]
MSARHLRLDAPAKALGTRASAAPSSAAPWIANPALASRAVQPAVAGPSAAPSRGNPVLASRAEPPIVAGPSAAEPPEGRGLRRDEVAMLVALRAWGEVVPTTFSALDEFVGPGDLLVVNTSGTIPAAIDALDRESGAALVVHLSSMLCTLPGGDEVWVVEPRRLDGHAGGPWAKRADPSTPRPPPADLLVGSGDAPTGTLRLLGPYHASGRLWLGRLSVPERPLDWLYANGRPVRYRHVLRPWPLDMYQTVFATEPGSAEMPSAGRPFSQAMVTRLVARGVPFAPVLLHTGVSSLEAGEPPYPERVRVSETTAERVNFARSCGGRVVAVGTTAVRAIESAFQGGQVRALDGWTDLVVTPEVGVRVVDGLLTGWHEPEASHLALVEAIAGAQLLRASYAAAIEHGYLWHEFGDVALYLP